ncbi:MAG: S8 family serine peptidase [Calditrichia bacterium]
MIFRRSFKISLFLFLALTASSASAEELLVQFKKPDLIISSKGVSANSLTIQGVLNTSPPQAARLLFPNRQHTLPKPLRNIYVLTYAAGKSGVAHSALQKIDDVVYVKPKVTLSIRGKQSDPLLAEQWYRQTLNIDEAWNTTRGDASIVVGIIDTGVDYRHEDLQGALWINNAEDLNGNGTLDASDENGIDDDGNGYVDDVVGWDFTDAPAFPDQGDYLDPDNDPDDEFLSGHGTPAAGLIAAQQNDVGIAGIAPGLRVMALRAGTASGFLEEDDVAEAILYAIDNGCRIVNMSFGDVAFSYLLRDVIRYGSEKGLIFVAAAGNSGSSIPNYPAAYAETISVGATTIENQRASFSSFGNTLNLVMPGQDVFATQIENGYGSFNGTSFSAPLACGVLGLILSANPNMTSEQAIGALYGSVQDLGLRGWDERYGHGLPDAARAVTAGKNGYVAITNPAGGDGTAADFVPVIGSAYSPWIDEVVLSYSVGETQQRWQEIERIDGRQVVDDTLTVWDTSSLDDGRYTLELRLKQLALEDVVVRQSIEIDRSPAVIDSFFTTKLYDKSKSAILMRFQTDDVTLARASFFDENGALLLNKTSTYRSRAHSFLIGEQELPTTSNVVIELQNTSGLNSQFGDNGNTISLSIPKAANPEYLLDFVGLLPVNGYFMPHPVDMNNNGAAEIVVSELIDERFGSVAVLETDGSNITRLFETAETGIPRAAGVLRSNGGFDLALGLGSRSMILGNALTDSIPKEVVWQDSSDFWISRIINTDDDAENEVLALRFGTWRIFEVDNAYQLSEKQKLSTVGEGSNVFGVPNALFADFNGDGKESIVVSDVSGQLIVYDRAGSEYLPEWTAQLNGQGGESLLAAADVDGDGVPEIAAAVRNQPKVLLESNVNDKFWSLSVWGFNDSGELVQLAEDNILGITAQSGIHNGLSAADLDNDGLDEIVFLPFPNGYAFGYEANELKLRWYQEGVNSNAAPWADFTGDGQKDLLLNTENGIELWSSIEVGERPAKPLGLKVLPLNETEIQLSWLAARDAAYYRIYSRTDDQFILADSTSATSFLVADLQTDSSFAYAITAVNQLLPQVESLFSRTVFAVPNRPPTVDSLVAKNDKQLHIYFSEALSVASFQTNRYRLNSRTPLSVARGENRSQAVLSFGESFEANNELLILALEDELGTRTADSLIVNFPFSEVIPDLYLTSVELISKTRLRVVYNLPLENASGGEPANYQLEPNVEVLSASVNDNVALLTLAIPNRLSVGEPHVLTITDVRGFDGNTLSSNGNSLQIVNKVQDLEKMVVFPNPWRGDRHDMLRFANVPAGTELFIFTATGTNVRALKNDNPFGSVEWDLKNDAGDKVGSGVYIYVARFEGMEKTGKLMVVN